MCCSNSSASVSVFCRHLEDSHRITVCVSLHLCRFAGVCFSCVIDVVPVKNEDGLVIMFILNFELPNDRRSPTSSPTRELNRVLRIPWLSGGKD